MARAEVGVVMGVPSPAAGSAKPLGRVDRGECVDRIGVTFV
jgi:hypothetical protein